MSSGRASYCISEGRMRLTVLFDVPYWVALLEVEQDGYLYAARHIFGAEPRDQEVYEFVQRDLIALQARITVGMAAENSQHWTTNFKRSQREITWQLSQQAVMSEAHDALRLQIEQNKRECKQNRREGREARRTQKQETAVAKAKARHRGR